MWTVFGASFSMWMTEHQAPVLGFGSSTLDVQCNTTAVDEPGKYGV